MLSVMLNFFMEFQARHAVVEIQKQLATTAAVLRDGLEQELSVADSGPRGYHQSKCGRPCTGGRPPAGHKEPVRT